MSRLNDRKHEPMALIEILRPLSNASRSPVAARTILQNYYTSSFVKIELAKDRKAASASLKRQRVPRHWKDSRGC